MKFTKGEAVAAVITLEEEGILFENQFTFLSNHYIRHRSNDIFEILRENGYEGELLAIGTEVNGQGWMYAIYSPKHFDRYKEAENAIRKHFASLSS